MADKKGRIQEIIQRNVSEIVLYELDNDICKFASIHKAELNSDNSLCKIYVSHIQRENEEKLVRYLNSKSSYIRSLLSKKCDLYKVPFLLFLLDADNRKLTEIERVIEKIRKSKKPTIKDL